MKVLILGGYGNFGQRLVELLRDEPDLTLCIAGRSQAKADAMVLAYDGASTLLSTPMDRADIVDRLGPLAPDLVVDLSGPFQDYGDDPYGVPRACVEHGVHYLDLADAAKFVAGIGELDAAARAAGAFVLSGVSTCPVLTSAVLDEMAQDFTVTSVRAGIAPSPHAGLGLSVMHAVVGYAGARIGILRGGKTAKAYGLCESIRFKIAPPRYRPLRHLHFSLVEVPDLLLLRVRFPELTDMWFGAGPVPEVFHRGLNVLAHLRAKTGVGNFTAMAPLFHKVLNRFGWGPDRGGMFVQATGQKNGQSASREWHVVAEGDDGPFIPVIPASVIIRKMLAGKTPQSGARVALGEVSLDEYRCVFARLDITEGYRDDTTSDVYQTVLGRALEDVPDPVRHLHDVHIWKGKAEVRGSTNILAKLVARIIGFPQTGADIPVTVTLTKDGAREVWQRDFDGQKFKSIQWAGTGRHAHLLMERFGPITVTLALEVRGDELHLIPVGWNFLGVPLPRFLLPRGATFETTRDGQFVFDVTIAAPIVGLIVAYRGTLIPIG